MPGLANQRGSLGGDNDRKRDRPQGERVLLAPLHTALGSLASEPLRAGRLVLPVE
jgi:hypothetical protein